MAERFVNMAETKGEGISPAYMPWKTFTNFINGLRSTDVPSQVNRSVMTNLSYSTQAQVLAGLKFLKLTDANGKPTGILQRLVSASDGDSAPIYKEMVEDCYAFVFETLDLSRATPEELEKAFRERGITGSTAARAAAFFLEAAEAAGIVLSAHLKKKNGASSGTASRRGTRRRSRPTNQTLDPIREEPTPPRTNKSFENQLLEKFPAFDPTWPKETQEKWFEGFKTLMAMAPKPNKE